MKIRSSLIMIVLMLMTMGCASFAFGAVSPEEASKLGGPVLTQVGAERAGNKDGTIPAWTGVPIPIPKAYVKGSGVYVDPFADEKPLFSINQKNMAPYADKLAEGVKALMKRHPDYRIDVYKTHRTMVYPQWYYDNTKRNATVCQTINDGRTLMGNGCHGGAPFPLPMTGNEAYWNHTLTFVAPESFSYDCENYIVTNKGRVTMATQALDIFDSIWNDPKREGDPRVTNGLVKFTGPPRRNGEIILASLPLDFKKRGLIVWQYLPGQRRVRLAPDVCCDTPNAGTGGAAAQDDAFVFQGDPDRFTWKLLGKKEMYIPYNAYKIVYYRGDVSKAVQARYLNPDMIRWELHRVWVVEATLRPDKRHIYAKRIFYADEDTLGFVMADNFDRHGNMYRMTVSYPVYSYDVQTAFSAFLSFYDLISNSYAVFSWPRLPGGVQYMKYHSESFFSPDSIAGGGLR